MAQNIDYVVIDRLYGNIHKKLKNMTEENGFKNLFNGKVYKIVNDKFVEDADYTKVDAPLFNTAQTLAYLGVSNVKYDKNKIPAILKTYKENSGNINKLISEAYKNLARVYAGKTIILEDKKTGKKYERSINDVLKIAKSNLKELGIDISKSKQEEITM